MESFLEKIKEALEIEDRDISMNDSFKDYDEWDSLNRLSLIVMIDEEYGVQIAEDKMNTCVSLMDLYEEIQKMK
ncbi:acyl carrier protein [Myroides odoratimimus]|uniref:acyl carrier protein n=1 Tax=Myroides odoratimimus TaxID=76832 RepID=UPI002577DD50|nr:acyl carrier protein [Myroides odoratimimus]